MLQLHGAGPVPLLVPHAGDLENLGFPRRPGIWGTSWQSCFISGSQVRRPLHSQLLCLHSPELSDSRAKDGKKKKYWAWAWSERRNSQDAAFVSTEISCCFLTKLNSVYLYLNFKKLHCECWKSNILTFTTFSCSFPVFFVTPFSLLQVVGIRIGFNGDILKYLSIWKWKENRFAFACLLLWELLSIFSKQPTQNNFQILHTECSVSSFHLAKTPTCVQEAVPFSHCGQLVPHLMGRLEQLLKNSSDFFVLLEYPGSKQIQPGQGKQWWTGVSKEQWGAQTMKGWRKGWEGVRIRGPARTSCSEQWELQPVPRRAGGDSSHCSFFPLLAFVKL